MSLTIDFKQKHQLEIPPALPWLKQAQQDALQSFKNAPLPNRKSEHWKYNNMHFLQQQAFVVAQTEDKKEDQQLAENLQKIPLNPALELVFINGDLSIEKNTCEQIRVTRFSQADKQQQAIIRQQVNAQSGSKNLFASLSTAINADGVLIEIKNNCEITQPVYIRQIASIKQQLLTNQQIVLHVGESSKAVLLEHFQSEASDNTHLCLQQTSIILQANSRLDHYRLNLQQECNRQINMVNTQINQQAQLNSFFIGLGSQLNRTDINNLHQAKNASSDVAGIYLPAKQQTIDYHLNVEHRAAHCNSQQIFRGIVADQASATFNGRIHIHQDAQKSDAYLNNKNLLLTNQAEINSKPELEIYADDVKCAHGATVAKLDEQAIYYLQTRGINKQKARKILSNAFIQQLLNDISLTELKIFLMDFLDQHMLKISQE